MNDDVEFRVPDRKTMLRDVAVFQLKLLADGFRDLLLVPVSLIAAIVALLKKGPHPGPEFYELLRAGRRSEHWINLFGAVPQEYGPEGEDQRLPGQDIDQLVLKVESFVVEEYRRGGVSAQAREKLDRVLQGLRNYQNRRETD